MCCVIYWIYCAFWINYLHSTFIYPQFLHFLYRVALLPNCGTGESLCTVCWIILEGPLWKHSSPILEPAIVHWIILEEPLWKHLTILEPGYCNLNYTGRTSVEAFITNPRAGYCSLNYTERTVKAVNIYPRAWLPYVELFWKNLGGSIYQQSYGLATVCWITLEEPLWKHLSAILEPGYRMLNYTIRTLVEAFISNPTAWLVYVELYWKNLGGSIYQQS